MRVVVTGGSGFLGTPILEKLEERGHLVLAISRQPPMHRRTNNIEWLQARLGMPTSYEAGLERFQPDACIHLAWEGIPDFSSARSASNLKYSIDFVSFLARLGSCEKLLVSGSCAEYGRKYGECIESEHVNPSDYFSWAKDALRSWTEITCEKKNIGLVWFRIFFAYGPRQRQSSIIPTIIRQLRAGQSPKISTPTSANDFIFSEDVADAFVTALDSDIAGGVYNLGSGSASPILEVLRIIEKNLLGSETCYKEIRDASKTTEPDSCFWANTEKTNAQLGWSPKSDLEDGIRKVIENM